MTYDEAVRMFELYEGRVPYGADAAVQIALNRELIRVVAQIKGGLGTESDTAHLDERYPS